MPIENGREAVFDVQKILMTRLRESIDALLESEDFFDTLPQWRDLPARKVINPLFSRLCSLNENLKMRAVKAMGVVVSNLADVDMESARVIMRRFMWNLNDESGGIGWGAPEAMGEIMAVHEKIADEYSHILLSYLIEDGNFLELELLQRGVLWGLTRLAEVRPDLLRKSASHIEPFLNSQDPILRGLAVRLLGLIKAQKAEPLIRPLLEDETEVPIFFERGMKKVRISELAETALDAMRAPMDRDG